MWAPSAPAAVLISADRLGLNAHQSGARPSSNEREVVNIFFTRGESPVLSCQKRDHAKESYAEKLIVNVPSIASSMTLRCKLYALASFVLGSNSHRSPTSFTKLRVNRQLSSYHQAEQSQQHTDLVLLLTTLQGVCLLEVQLLDQTCHNLLVWPRRAKALQRFSLHPQNGLVVRAKKMTP